MSALDLWPGPSAGYGALIKYVQGWKFLTIEAAETLCMVCSPSDKNILKKYSIWVTDLSKSHIL